MGYGHIGLIIRADYQPGLKTAIVAAGVFHTMGRRNEPMFLKPYRLAFVDFLFAVAVKVNFVSIAEVFNFFIGGFVVNGDETYVRKKRCGQS